MLVKAILKNSNGKELGIKSIPEDCLAIRYGGSIFVARDPEHKMPGVMTYLQTDVFEFNRLDGEK